MSNVNFYFDCTSIQHHKNVEGFADAGKKKAIKLDKTMKLSSNQVMKVTRECKDASSGKVYTPGKADYVKGPGTLKFFKGVTHHVTTSGRETCQVKVVRADKEMQKNLDRLNSELNAFVKDYNKNL